MKKLLLTVIITAIIFVSSAWALPQLRGIVSKSGGGGLVGQGKPVFIKLTYPDWDTTYTAENSWYCYSFQPGTYVNRVECNYWEGDTYWHGLTYINQTLYVDSRYDITVSSGPPDK